MTEPLEQLQTWRNEIASELAAAELVLAEALKEQSRAEAEQRVALASAADWQQIIAPLRPPIAHVLAQRLASLGEGPREAAGAVACAKTTVENTRYFIEDRRQALREIDRILTANAETMAPAEVA